MICSSSLTAPYRDAFFTAVHEKDNVTYHGVFTGDADAVYRELCQYDALLLPTRWKAEGLPGILIEAKFAGVAAVVSDHNFNREIVAHNQDGIVIEEVTADKLIMALQKLDDDREKLLHMKFTARSMAEKYDIDVCASEVLQVLESR